MTEQEERDLARRLADGSEIFDFDLALELVKSNLAGAEKLIRNREETKRWSEEFARARERRRQAFIEEFGYAPPRAS
ncbi:MAG TPA: hypothetical protein VFU11_01440 [Solirubrobacterales bacterium]|nr:hypothetical protein [Solirubrobacterales bacterium]